MNTQPLTSSQISSFQQDGYLLIDGLLDTAEVALLQRAARGDATMQQAAMDVRDTEGRSTGLSLWNHPGEDIYGAIARSERIVYGMQQLLDDEVYHYHSKLSAKEPRVGGAWEWHQDYGYWYENGCLYPDMASVFIAVDRCTQENGCIQVLRGSHLCGRIDHGRYGEQTGADPARVEPLKERCELVHCVMEPGAGLFFHANLLHASAANLSDEARWGLLCCYNTRHNDPFEDSHHPRYTPLDVLPDHAIKQVGATGTQPSQEFLRQQDDQTTG
ncbi:MAG: phytanoyl-CoA dioxygenase family protein [Blastopirellula sp.]|nr:phytanoyl-CoA dioxygenase family protein [Blastopirellula sp.]